MTIAEVESNVCKYATSAKKWWNIYRKLESQSSQHASAAYREYLSRWFLLEKNKKELTIMKMENVK